MRRRAWLMMGLAALPMSAQAGDLDDPPIDHPLWRLVKTVEAWANNRPLPRSPEITVAFLRLSTGCHRFAQGVSLYIESPNDDERGARIGLDELARALRHILALAERVDPEWRGFIDDSALNAPTVRDWLTTASYMTDVFDVFYRAGHRFEWIARRLAEG